MHKRPESDANMIDWFTICAQALNFLILVLLLKRFLYKPILLALDAREKQIAASLADAEAKTADADKRRSEFQQKSDDFDRQRAALLAKATGDAKVEGERLMTEARHAADAMAAQRQDSLRFEAANLNKAVAGRIQAEVFAITRLTLSDLATAELEGQMVAVFTRHLRAMDEQSRNKLGKSLKSSSDPAIVRTTFDLPADQRTAVQNAVNVTFAADIHLRFETSPNLIGGIELVSDGQKVGWNIAGQLRSLEETVADLVGQSSAAPPVSTVKIVPPPARKAS